MSVNSSSTSNFSNFSVQDFRGCANINIAYFVVKTIITVPLSILILYLGHQRWRQQGSFKTMSHSDIFTYHTAAMELLFVLGGYLYALGMWANLLQMLQVAICLTCIGFYGVATLHIVTTVERYLAVVHPIIYLGLRNARGVRIRNISIGCVWLLCFGWMGATLKYLPDHALIPILCFLVFSLIVVSFCSLSMLCVLIRPGPGEGGRERQQTDQAKHRAFCLVAAIMGALCFQLIGLLVAFTMYNLPHLSKIDHCLLFAATSWCNLPSCLVLPLLYLQRAGKLSCCYYE